LLRIPTMMIFVESAADEEKVRLGFPDVLSLVSYECRLFKRDKQDQFAASDASVLQRSELSIEEPALLSGTLQEVHESYALCWLEVSPGVRVKFSVPLTLLAGLNPQPNMELLWYLGKEGESPTFRKREPKPANPELVREVKERYQSIRNT